jgi:ADP-heptose:LPS heptosyltransferase
VYEDDPQKHFLQAYYDKFKLKDGYMRYPSLQHFITDAAAPKKKMIAFHITNNSVPQLYRKVHGIDWVPIFQYVASLGYDVLLINQKEELNLKGEFPFLNFFSGSFKNMVNALNNCSYFIGVDSAPSHIAASLKVPSIIFFGSINPFYRHILPQFKGFFLQGFCEKQGCYHTQPKNQQICLINNDQYIVPKCTLHNNDELISTIQKLIAKYEV